MGGREHPRLAAPRALPGGRAGGRRRAGKRSRSQANPSAGAGLREEKGCSSSLRQAESSARAGGAGQRWQARGAPIGTARLGWNGHGSDGMGTEGIGAAATGWARIGSMRLGWNGMGTAWRGSAVRGQAVQLWRRCAVQLDSAWHGPVRLGVARLGTARLGSAWTAWAPCDLTGSSCTVTARSAKRLG